MALEDAELHRLRLLAVRWCEYACNGSKGRPEHGDPVYDWVTEWRDGGDWYSSCADLAHWVLYRIGVRSSWINRQEHNGFVVGAGVSRLCWKAPAFSPSGSESLLAGDIVVTWAKPDTSDAHVSVVIEHEREAGRLLSADYGQPGGKLRTRPCRAIGSRIILGTKDIRRVVRLERIVNTAPMVGAEELPDSWGLK
jgi:hypothetical protein